MSQTAEKIMEAKHVESQSTAEPGVQPSKLEERRLVRRIDLHLMPLMVVTYMLQYFDKTTLGYTAILGILEDTHLAGNQYSWVSSAFYFGYLVASYPASFAFVKLPIAKFLTGCIFLWAIVLACHGAANSFTSLMVLRILLGAFESTISPGMSLITGLWYRPEEHALRHGIWFAGNGFASLVGGLLAYAISHINGSIASWRWLFIIFGLVTFAWGLILLIFLPDSPNNARFLSPDDKEFAARRPQQMTRSFKSTTWKKDQFMEAVKDPKTWFLFVYTVCSTVPNGGFTNFSSIIVKGFGFSTFDTLLLNMPVAAFQIIWVSTSSLLAWKVRKSRCFLIAGLQLVALTGSALVYAIPQTSRWGRMAGLWLMPAYAAGFPLSLSLIASNVAGYTKKTTVSAILFIGYCLGNIIGPQIFFPEQAPRYQSGFIGMITCFGLSSFTILCMRQYMVWCNTTRNVKQARTIDPEGKEGGISTEEHLVRTGADQTDFENEDFRYYL